MEDYSRPLASHQCHSLRAELHNLGYGAGMEDLFWLPLPQDALSPLQQEHAATCGPYALAVEVHNNSVSMELLVRARNSLCCDCIHPATPELASRMQATLESLLNSVGVSPAS